MKGISIKPTNNCSPFGKEQKAKEKTYPEAQECKQSAHQEEEHKAHTSHEKNTLFSSYLLSPSHRAPGEKCFFF